MLAYIVDQKEKNKLIGRRIREAREAKGWSQDALADELDTKQATVARWEGGTFPKRIGLPKIASALEKPVEWFTTGTNYSEIEQRLRILESRAALGSPSKEYSALSPVPPELFAKYNTDLSHQLLTNYFLTRQDRYIEHLGNEIIEHVEAISRLLGLKRSPSPTSDE